MIDLLSSKHNWRELMTAAVPMPPEKDIARANRLVSAAKNHAAAGDEQMRYGDAAKDLMLTQTDEKIRLEFARISVWHYEKCAGHFRRSAVAFEAAAQIPNDAELQLILRRTAREMTEKSSVAETSARPPQEFLGAQSQPQNLVREFAIA